MPPSHSLPPAATTTIWTRRKQSHDDVASAYNFASPPVLFFRRLLLLTLHVSSAGWPWSTSIHPFIVPSFLPSFLPSFRSVSSVIHPSSILFSLFSCTRDTNEFRNRVAAHLVYAQRPMLGVKTFRPVNTDGMADQPADGTDRQPADDHPGRTSKQATDRLSDRPTN